MTKIRELAVREHETALKQNDRWLNAMMDADEDGRDQRDFLHVADRMLEGDEGPDPRRGTHVPTDGPLRTLHPAAGERGEEARPCEWSR